METLNSRAQLAHSVSGESTLVEISSDGNRNPRIKFLGYNSVRQQEQQDKLMKSFQRRTIFRTL